MYVKQESFSPKVTSQHVQRLAFISHLGIDLSTLSAMLSHIRGLLLAPESYLDGIPPLKCDGRK